MLEDTLLLEVVEEVNRKLSRKSYEKLLIDLELVSLSELKDNDELSGLTKYNLILETLRSVHNQYDILYGLYKRRLLSKELYSHLVQAGIDFGDEEGFSEPIGVDIQQSPEAMPSGEPTAARTKSMPADRPQAKKRRSNLSRNQKFTLAIAILAIVASIVAAFISGHDWFAPKTPTTAIAATASYSSNITLISTAKGDEVLIIVTNFSGSSDFNVETRIEKELTDRISKSGLTNVRIGWLGDQTPRTEQEAKEIGSTYQATIVIWGIVDPAGIAPYYTVIKNKEFITTQPALNSIASDLPTFNPYISEGAPNDYAYLMFFSIGQIALYRGDYEKAISLFTDAIDIDLGPRADRLDRETVFLYRGGAYGALEKTQEAIADFTRANSLNLTDPTPDLYISRTYAREGDYNKALQYAESAVKDKPTDANLRGNYGVMYYRNFRYQEAVDQLSLAINGNKTEDGLPINGLPLTNDLRVAEYYYTYGLALARTNQCRQALPIAQTLQTTFPSDDIVLEGANAIIQICQQNLNLTLTPPSP